MKPKLFVCWMWLCVLAHAAYGQAVPEQGGTIRIPTDLIVLDAQVMQQKTKRPLDGLQAEDFVVYEDGVKQTLTNFRRDARPLSVLFLMDWHHCPALMHRELLWMVESALEKLKPEDELAVADSDALTGLKMVREFSRNKNNIAQAIARLHIGAHDEAIPYNEMFIEAARLMERASNPEGRRVIVLYSNSAQGTMRARASSQSAIEALLESGSIVCWLNAEFSVFGNSGDRPIDEDIAMMMSRRTVNLRTLVNLTGGEILDAPVKQIDVAFRGLLERLRTRYSLGFVSSNAKRDGTVRRLRLEIAPTVQQRSGPLVVVSRRSYIAPKEKMAKVE